MNARTVKKNPSARCSNKTGKIYNIQIPNINQHIPYLELWCFLEGTQAV
jgi:hypothetical protein